MDYYDKLLMLNKYYEHLQDDESRIIFRARINYMIDRDEEAFFKAITYYHKEWKWQEYDNLNKSEKPIVIYGCGRWGQKIKKVLELCNIKISYFCDSNNSKVGTLVDGIEVISKWELLDRKNDYFVIVGSRIYGKEIYIMLMDAGYPQSEIFWLSSLGGDEIISICGKQYFDVFNPNKNEYFIDAGAFNGNTILEFAKWAGDTMGGV